MKIQKIEKRLFQVLKKFLPVEDAYRNALFGEEKVYLTEHTSSFVLIFKAMQCNMYLHCINTVL